MLFFSNQRIFIIKQHILHQLQKPILNWNPILNDITIVSYITVFYFHSKPNGMRIK